MIEDDRMGCQIVSYYLIFKLKTFPFQTKYTVFLSIRMLSLASQQSNSQAQWTKNGFTSIIIRKTMHHEGSHHTFL